MFQLFKWIFNISPSSKLWTKLLYFAPLHCIYVQIPMYLFLQCAYISVLISKIIEWLNKPTIIFLLFLLIDSKNDICKMVISCCFEWVWRILLNGKWMDVKLSTGLSYTMGMVFFLSSGILFFRHLLYVRYFFYSFI